MITYPTNKLQKVLLSGGCEQRNLPSGYTQVEYLETDGNSYIDTGVLLNNTDPFDITFQSSKNALTAPIMGAISGGTAFTANNNICVTYNIANSINSYSVYCNGAAGTASAAWNGGNYADKLKHTIKYTGLNIAPTIDGVTMSQKTPTTLTTSNATVTTWLFGRNNTGSGSMAQDGVRIFDTNFYAKGHFIPCRRNSDSVLGMYDTVTGNFLTNAGTDEFIAGPNVVPTPDTPMDIVCNNGVIKVDSQGNIYIQGTQEVVTDNLGNTAGAEMLLAVGDYKDTQEVISGSVTRNVGVVVLNGTEHWELATLTNLVQFYMPNTQGLIKNNVSLISTIAPYGCTVSTRTQYDFGCYSGNSGYLCFQMKGSATLTTVAQFKQYLADQYAQGTPVIIVYPLATPTTEQVTPQPLAGSSATITAGSIDNLSIESSTIAELKKRYIGDKEVKKVYIGDNLVWENN